MDQQQISSIANIGPWIGFLASIPVWGIMGFVIKYYINKVDESIKELAKSNVKLTETLNALAQANISTQKDIEFIKRGGDEFKNIEFQAIKASKDINAAHEKLRDLERHILEMRMALEDYISWNNNIIQSVNIKLVKAGIDEVEFNDPPKRKSFEKKRYGEGR